MVKTTYKQTTTANKQLVANKRKSGNRLLELIQINSKKFAGLDNQLAAGNQSINDKLVKELAALLEGQQATAGNYKRLAADNDAAESDNSFQNLMQQRQERSAALQQVQLQGGGETDALKAQAMSLKNWDANQGKTNRAYADTLTSINNNIVDSNTQTKAQYTNAINQADANMRQAFNEWKNSTGEVLKENSDSYTQALNAFNEAEDSAYTQVQTNKSSGTKNVKSTQTQSSNSNKLSKQQTTSADSAFKGLKKNTQAISDLTNKSFTSTLENKTPEQMGFQAQEEQEQKQNMNNLGSAQTLTKMKKPEGASGLDGR